MMGSKRALIIFVILLVLYWTVPSKESLWPILRSKSSLAKQFWTRLTSPNPIKYFHGHIFILAKYGKDFFLGLLNSWIQVPAIEPVWDVLMGFQNGVSSILLKNHRGIHLKNGKSYCFLPGYTGLGCDQKVEGFVSIWTLVAPVISQFFAPLWQRVIRGNVYIFGIPWYALPQPIINVGRQLGLVNLSSHLSVLDTYFLAVIFGYLLSLLGICAKKRKRNGVQNERGLYKNLKKSLKKAGSLFVSPVIHHNFYDVFITLLGIHVFAIPVAQVYGHLILIRTYLLWIILNMSLLLIGSPTFKGSFGFLSALGMLYSFTRSDQLEILSLALLLHLLTRDLGGSLLGLALGFGLKSSALLFKL